MDSPRLARVGAIAFFCTLAAASPSRAAEGTPLRIELWADQDDDDADGRPDGEQSVVPRDARVDLVTIDPCLAGTTLDVLSGAEHARIVAPTGAPIEWGRPVSSKDSFEGLSPGRVELISNGGGAHVRVTLMVDGVQMRDGDGRVVDMARSHASLERTPPERIQAGPDAKYDDADALRLVVVQPIDASGSSDSHRFSVESLDPFGVVVDGLDSIDLSPVACSPGLDAHCSASAPLRLVTDDADRDHPLAVGRSVKAQVGGAIVFRRDGHKTQMIRVLGPRSTPAGPIGRLRASVRPFVVRVVPGGAPSVGGNDTGAVELVRGELRAAAAVWGQCGVTFGDLRHADVQVVDPPPSHLLSIGDDLGFFASGGEIRLRVDGRPIAAATARGEPPEVVARRVGAAVERAGLAAVISSNARIASGLGPSVDVSLRRRDGTPASADSIRGVPLSTDATLSVRIGSLDLTDGLEHFTDMNAVAGTLEERTLIKAFDQGDPATIRVFVVPLFAGGGRIGESFIGSDSSSIRNVVLLDRAGVRARKSSQTLAHELGHVFMDLPGHPDDYGFDTPTELMDSDASDATPFGPRRITLDQCARVLREAGPGSRFPLLVDWPIGPVPITAWRRQR